MNQRDRLREEARRAEHKARQAREASRGTMSPQERRRYRARAASYAAEAAALRDAADRAR
jgi:hypothetical protein